MEGLDCETRALAMHNVHLRRYGRVIVDDVNLEVGRGEKWILFGPNGIGKSSLISMMSTRAFPTSGDIDVLGRRLGKVDVFSYRHLIGLSSAELSRAFPPFEDPLDVVVTALSATTGRWKDTYTSDEYARARRLMEDFGIAYLAGKQFGRLSEGEWTRTLICRALMAQSELLILDEPTTGLDLGAREITIRALSSLHDDPRTIIVVTHHLEEIPQGFDHIAIMGRQSTVTSQPDPADPAPGTIEYAGDLEHGLTAERLSRLFGMPLDVHYIDGRWSAFARI